MYYYYRLLNDNEGILVYLRPIADVSAMSSSYSSSSSSSSCLVLLPYTCNRTATIELLFVTPTGSSYGLVLLSNCCLHRPQSSLLCLLLTPSLQTLPTQWPWFDPSIWSLVFQHWRWCAHQNTTTDNSTQYTTTPQSSILHHHILSKEVVHGQLNCHSVCRGCNVLWSPHSFVVGWNMLVEV